MFSVVFYIVSLFLMIGLAPVNPISFHRGSCHMPLVWPSLCLSLQGDLDDATSGMTPCQVRYKSSSGEGFFVNSMWLEWCCGWDRNVGCLPLCWMSFFTDVVSIVSSMVTHHCNHINKYLVVVHVFHVSVWFTYSTHAIVASFQIFGTQNAWTTWFSYRISVEAFVPETNPAVLDVAPVQKRWEKSEVFMNPMFNTEFTRSIWLFCVVYFQETREICWSSIHLVDPLTRLEIDGISFNCQ